MKYFEQLAQQLGMRFPNKGMRVEPDKDPPEIVFPAAHPAVGDLIICDDGDEITIYYGNFTHCRYADYCVPDGKTLVEHVVDRIEDLFNDKVVMWGKHMGSGGIHPRGEKGWLTPPEDRSFVWSGPLKQ